MKPSVLATLCLAALSGPAAAETDSSALRNAVTLEAIRAHQAVLAEIAAANGGTRGANGPGNDASARYVGEKLRDAGYQVTIQAFHFPMFQENSPSDLARTAPDPKSYVHGTDFLTVRFSAAGSVQGVVVPTKDVMVPPAPEPISSSGCELEDFPPAPSEPAIALVQRGTCVMRQKVDNAAAAGYDAVLIFNEGQEGRQKLEQMILDGPFSIPALSTSFAVGEELYLRAQAGKVHAQVHVAAETVAAQTVNVIAEAPGGNPQSVVVVGAHLDSVTEGPGINDNGSGLAVIIEIAIQLARLGIETPNRLRFAFWGGEEEGLLGSAHYVQHLTSKELNRIALNLNFDMLGSPNPVSFIYDGDGSANATAGPPGSGAIENIFADYFKARNLPTRPTALDGRSDYGSFLDKGIPAGGIESGAEGLKTADEAADFGGKAGEPYDRCYHQACDGIDNVSLSGLNLLADAAAHAILQCATELPVAVAAASRKGATRAASAVPLDTLPYRGGSQLQK